MAYVYRYINLDAREVVYIGKVKGDEFENLIRRHKQHKREDWYKENKNNIIMQYAEVPTAADADILETIEIAYYADTNQLINKDKTSWGSPQLFLDGAGILESRWRTYGCTLHGEKCLIEEIKRDLIRCVDEWWSCTVRYDDLKNDDECIENVAKNLGTNVKSVLREILNGQKYARLRDYNDFRRIKQEEVT